jgi:hypothetical protein
MIVNLDFGASNTLYYIFKYLLFTRPTVERGVFYR